MKLGPNKDQGESRSTLPPVDSEVPDCFLSRADFLQPQSLRSPASTFYRVQGRTLGQLHSKTSWGRGPVKFVGEPKNLSERELGVQILNLDRLANRKIGKLSRDLSCAFEPKCGHHETSQSSAVLPATISEIEQAIKTQQNPGPSPRAVSSVINKLAKKHLSSIYKSPGIMNDNLSAIKDERDRLGRILERNTRQESHHSFVEPSEKRVPLVSLGLPTSRRQVEMIDLWLQEMCAELGTGKLQDKREVNEGLLTVHQFALLEVIRQTAVQCFERGDFLRRVLNKYTELIIEKHSYFEEELRECKKHAKRERDQLKSEITASASTIQLLTGKVQSLQDEVAERDKTIAHIRSMKDRQDVQLDELKDEVKALKTQLTNKRKALENRLAQKNPGVMGSETDKSLESNLRTPERYPSTADIPTLEIALSPEVPQESGNFTVTNKRDRQMPTRPRQSTKGILRSLMAPPASELSSPNKPTLSKLRPGVRSQMIQHVFALNISGLSSKSPALLPPGVEEKKSSGKNKNKTEASAVIETKVIELSFQGEKSAVEENIGEKPSGGKEKKRKVSGRNFDLKPALSKKSIGKKGNKKQKTKEKKSGKDVSEVEEIVLPKEEFDAPMADSELPVINIKGAPLSPSLSDKTRGAREEAGEDVIIVQKPAGNEEKIIGENGQVSAAKVTNNEDLGEKANGQELRAESSAENKGAESENGDQEKSSAKRDVARGIKIREEGTAKVAAEQAMNGGSEISKAKANTSTKAGEETEAENKAIVRPKKQIQFQSLSTLTISMKEPRHILTSDRVLASHSTQKTAEIPIASHDPSRKELASSSRDLSLLSSPEKLASRPSNVQLAGRTEKPELTPSQKNTILTREVLELKTKHSTSIAVHLGEDEDENGSEGEQRPEPEAGRGLKAKFDKFRKRGTLAVASPGEPTRRESQSTLVNRLAEYLDKEDTESNLSFRSESNEGNGTFELDASTGEKKRTRPGHATALLKRVLSCPERFKRVHKAGPRIVHKFVSQLYQDLLQLYKDSMQSIETAFHLKHRLHVFAYRSLLNQYGIQLVADRKFVQLVLGVQALAANSSPRIKLFASFLEVSPPAYNEGELEFYLKAFNFTTRLCNVGVVITNNESSDVYLVPLVRAQEFARRYFQPKLRHDDWAELKRKIDALRVSDAKNMSGAIDLDAFINLALQKFKRLVGTTQDYVKDVFKACDLDGNNHIDLEEFLLLSRCLEPVRLPREKAARLFNKLSDTVISLEGANRAISFPSFAIGCVENDLFTLDVQHNFLKVKEKSECLKQLNSMSAGERTRMIEARFKRVGKYDKYAKWWISPIEQALKSDYTSTANIILIKFKLLEAESISVCQELLVKETMGPLNVFTELIA